MPFLWAAYQDPKQRVERKKMPKLSLDSLSVGKKAGLQVAQKHDNYRWPAAARTIDPAKSRVYMVGGCRGPYGNFYAPSPDGHSSVDYEECMNSDHRFSDRGPFHSKTMGIGMVVFE